ncbi:La ribonucleoprotein domain member 1B [Bonamia ostreae]|uniref:La ribonucleoprotein domain member 1B n=1 Tax=Bonamia ostreae TaxID=126728 RepID=A0ABV2AFK2_9EUKA
MDNNFEEESIFDQKVFLEIFSNLTKRKKKFEKIPKIDFNQINDILQNHFQTNCNKNSQNKLDHNKFCQKDYLLDSKYFNIDKNIIVNNNNDLFQNDNKNIIDHRKNGEDKKIDCSKLIEQNKDFDKTDFIKNAENNENLITTLLPYRFSSTKKLENYLAVFSPYFYLTPIASQFAIINDNINGLVRFHFVKRKEVFSQIKYYFSEKNLKNDEFLRRNADRNGFIKIDLLLEFPCLKFNLVSIDLIKECCVELKELEYFCGYIRSSQFWWKYKAVKLPKRPEANLAYDIPIKLMKDVLMDRLQYKKVNESSFAIFNEKKSKTKFCPFANFVNRNRIGYYDVTSNTNVFLRNLK